LQHIRELYAAKERAIANEDYDAAKSLRDAIEQLKEVGGRIAKLELRKKAAVQAEDYDTAKQIKAEIDRMRHSLGNAPPPQLQVPLCLLHRHMTCDLLCLLHRHMTCDLL
jgi:hypothetical protein